MTRIKADMSAMDIEAAMSDGNPGAVSVMGMILKTDPSMGLFKILSLDAHGIYGSDIWLFFKDFCMLEKGAKTDEEAIKMMMEILSDCERICEVKQFLTNSIYSQYEGGEDEK